MGPKSSQKIGKFKFKDLFQTLESGCWGSCDLCSPSDRILGIFLSMLRFGLNLWNSEYRGISECGFSDLMFNLFPPNARNS